jgi:ABC-type polysaccharide/polyol phosphate transport system ATPase subunit
MSEFAIRVQGLGKQYRIGHVVRRTTLRDALTSGVREAGLAMFSPARRRDRGSEKPTIWALHDVTFEIARGESVGVIGPNGAGKSTLLKILSRITEPTEGDAWIDGRVGSLLEVGTGFHGELTGRENVYLNGAILGMKRSEIDRKFDEIVSFAEVEQFIDTPVKHYSSGMYLRLGFAVAAHLEPEILVVDEVLSVGDASFQRKCMRKIRSVVQEGRTVLFVSHNLDAVQQLCPRSIVLDQGRMAAWGDSRSVVSQYLSRYVERCAPNVWINLSGGNRVGSGEVRFVAVRYSGSRETAHHASHGGRLRFEIQLDSKSDRTVDSLAVGIRTQAGVSLIGNDIFTKGEIMPLRQGINGATFEIETLLLNPGIYIVALWVGEAAGAAYDFLDMAFEIEVFPSRSDEERLRSESRGPVPCRFTFSPTLALCDPPEDRFIAS